MADSPKFPRRRRSIWGNLIAVALVAVSAVLAVRVQWLAADGDFAMANVASLLLAMVVGLVVVIRVVTWPGLSRAQRWVTLGTLVAVLGLLIGSLRIDRVSGRLVPSLRFRWMPKPDQLLEIPDAAGDSSVDLATSTDRDFPQFLGPQRNLKYDGVRLAETWSQQPPKQLWRQPIGAGWSSFAAVNGFAVTMEQRGPKELVSCYSIDGGQLIWSHAVDARHETVLGGVGPRCTPTIDEGRVYALGATGIMRCLEGASGKLLWQDDLLARYGVTAKDDLKAVAWGRSASPLIVGSIVVVPLGGPAGGQCVSLIAYDKQTGEVKWTGGDRQVSYASPSLEELAGEQQIVIVSEDTVSGHRIADGHPLWAFPWEGNSAAAASASQAVAVGDDRLLLSKAYGQGAELIRIVRQDDQWDAESVWKKLSVLKTKFTNVVVIDGFAYGLSDGILECIEVDTGTRRWKDRRQGDFGHGQILAVHDRLLVQAESGEVVMVAADPGKLTVLGQFEALDDQTWNNLCLYGDKLLVRNSVEAACYQLPLAEAE